ncbi:MULTISPECIES: glycoside hydrolase family 16 protein [unclassified Streptomyces]|uniref:glycoside hydrolase family 16 protein n=1 Tax=unclassified Streptomyces TaxID=2593676 RepID=UPI00081E4691|nr:glycoside hydrolase family 16 protein [Streptomyces sp. ScaeMP-e83]MYR92244.1 family 16 glycosylhydrolase [Streptomyces sp. SID4937]SCD30129.1 Beta-glucanase, GH16 family [Streptomyces sp. ScaeMP-e83]
MKHHVRPALMFAVGALLAGCVSAPAGAGGRAPDSDEPFWQAEFGGAAGERPSAEHWNTEIGNRDEEGWGNNELQFYTDDAANSALDGSGHLVITARRAPEGAAGLPCHTQEACPWTSARLTTAGKAALTHGRVEVRAKMPTGTGLLPAIWMLGDNGAQWPRQGEIDISEVVGGEPRTVYGTAHGPTYYNERGIGGSTTLPADASQAFHTYAVEKRPHRVTWSVDGKPYFTLTPNQLPAERDWVFEQDMHLLLNVAVGGDWPGSPDDSTRFPASMTIDYVRFYGTGRG